MGDGRFDGLQDVQGLISDEAVTPTLSTQIIADGGFGSRSTGTNENFSNETGRGRTGYSEGGLATMFTRRR